MLRRAIRFAGVDRAVFYALLNKAALIVSSVVTLALVVGCLSPARQGYYYTFASLVVLQNLLDLGMGTVLVQFVSHEWSRLCLAESGSIDGDHTAIARVSALVAVAVRWYGWVSIAFFLLVGTAGVLFLTRHGTPDGVLEPWWFLSAAVSISILQVPLRSVLEGSDQIARVQRIATLASSGGAIVGWIALTAGLELYSLAIGTSVTAVLGLILLRRTCRPFLCLRRSHERVFSWRHEFWPQQWRILISWMCGFFMFQSFVPILFFYQGSVWAGRMGASLQIYTAINSIASTWAYAKGPQMGMLGARASFLELRTVVREVVLRGTIVAAGLSVLAVLALTMMHWMQYRSDRFIDLSSMSILLVATIVLQRANVETLAVRFQKTEPFVLNSIVSAVLVCCSNILMAKYSGELGICIGFALIICLVTVPWCHRIYLANLADRAEVKREGMCDAVH